MNTEVLKQHAEDIKSFIKEFNTTIEEDKFVSKELWKTVGAINSKIRQEEWDSRNKEMLTYELIDGQSVLVPYFMKGLGNNSVFKLIDGDLYELPTQLRLDKDGSFHHWAYVYVKLDENKHVRLCIRLLGKDYHGNRIFTESSYFKKIESNDSYYGKDYGKNNRFPEIFTKQVHTIIDEFNKLDGVENFNPLKKSK